MNIITNLLFPQSSKKNTTGLPPLKPKVRGVHCKSAPEIQKMRESSKIVAIVLKEMSEMIEPGITTGDLDAYAEKRIRDMGATPSFKGYYGFPGSICASINNEVVHGIPSPKRVLRRGDIIKIDTGAYYQDFHGDSCITVPVGKISAQAAKLIEVAEAALYKGIEQVKAGNHLLDIAGAVEDYTKAHKFSIVQEFTGHGVGKNLHESPSVFNFRTDRLPNVKLKAGMTLAIEPIINAGSRHTRTLRDRWTVVTVDNNLSAQFEHTVLVTKDGYEILTDRSNIYQ